ncbi:MAG: T9SS type A sorting domain-containing protein, partial [Candidatus Krumholzibacteriia bacterium]
FFPLADIEYTIYEAIAGKIMRPPGNADAGGNRRPMPGADDDDDGAEDEETLNGFDEDGDGLIDEDFGQIGNQMMVLTMLDNTALAQESFTDHTPMNLELVQTSFQWENDQVDDFVGFDYKITNIGVTDIERVYIGFYADADIGPRAATGTALDDRAGSWRGVILASDGGYVPVEVSYMYDAAVANPLPGYFGILFLGHDVDPTGNRAPTSVGMRTFQKFQGQASFPQGGDPTNDDEAYQLLSAEAEDWDDDTAPNRVGDFRFLVSAGPFRVLEPEATLDFQVGIVMGQGLQGLLTNCAEAALTYFGVWDDQITNQTNLDGDPLITGHLGRETMLCREDFAVGGSQENPFNNFFPDFMDTSCVDAQWVLAQGTVADADLFTYEFGPGDVRTCGMFNMDNCFECLRQTGHVCGPMDFESGIWRCNDPDAESYAGCTGVEGLDTQINWLVGMAPPPPEGLRLLAADSRVHVFWDDLSEHTADVRMQVIDFESYRIWRADNWDRPFGSSLINGPESTLWQLVAEYDLVNSYLSTRGDTIALGANTGLDVISYTPVCLSDPRFAGLAEAMQEIVDADTQNLLAVRPSVRGPDGLPVYPALVPWETYTQELDTFFAVAERLEDDENDVKAKRGVKYYEYIDRDIHNGFIYFYSVTASDHELRPGSAETDLAVGPGLVGDPGSSFDSTVPGTAAQSAADREKDGANIYVYPNPATRDALAEFQQLFPNGDDPTGVRVEFANLPMARNTIQIYTAAGDLVQTIQHDGTSGVGHVSWNLMSRNGQEIVSGIYLYSVQSDNDRFEDFIGKFVVIR